MISRRVVVLSSLIATAISFFTLGVMHARRGEGVTEASYAAKLDAIRNEVKTELGRVSHADGMLPAGTAGQGSSRRRRTSNEGGSFAPSAGASAAASAPAWLDGARAEMVAEIKEELQREMGLLPVRLLRERRSSFVELYSYDNRGKTNYGTAGYLGGGYFITVKHAVVVLRDDEDQATWRRIEAIKVVYRGKEIPARIVDTGDASAEVHNGDWAIIRTRALDIPPLHVDTAFPYEFAAPIFRLGNDYSKGIMLSTGYIGQRTSNGLVTCLTDGHPGVSGGGVLDQRGDLIGIPIGRMQGDYRFSFILPLRAEMFRKVPRPGAIEPDATVAADTHP